MSQSQHRLYEDMSREALIEEIERLRMLNNKFFVEMKRAKEHARTMAGMVQVIRNVEESNQEPKQ